MKRREILRGVALLPFLNTNIFEKNTQIAVNQEVKRKKIVKPKRLEKGETVGIVAPAGPLSKEVVDTCVENLEKLGFKVKVGKNVLAQNGYLAGTDTQRAEDLMWAFSDKEIRCVWCIRGGYGAMRILPMLDFEVIKKNPKLMIGYSDITALHLAIHQRTGLVTLHGPAGNLDYSDFARPFVLDMLTKPTPQYELKNAEENLKNESNLFKLETITAGKSRGQLIGGNLSLLSAMDGTPYQMKDIKGKILFLEDIEERPYRVDRMLTQMLQAHDFRQLAGIACGVFEGCNPKENEKSLSLIEVLRDRLGNLGIPVVYGLSFGHIKSQYTIPVGIMAELDSSPIDKNTSDSIFTLLESATV